MTFPLALAIIEDQAAIRETLHEYLCAQPEFRCVLLAESVEDFLARLPTAAEPPQLILSDIGLPGLTGTEGIPLIMAQLPTVQVACTPTPSGCLRRCGPARWAIC